jgi:hypothetical protein
MSTFDIQSTQANFKPYRSHRVVRAAEITAIHGPTCVGVGPDKYSITFDPLNKPKPQLGWWVMCYDDGYISFSPPESFTKNYTEVQPYEKDNPNTPHIARDEGGDPATQ